MMLKKNKGFTLVEAVISIAIISIIAVAFLNAFTYGYVTVLGAGNETEAMAIAQTHMDKVWKAGENGSITSYSVDTMLGTLVNCNSDPDSIYTYAGENEKYSWDEITEDSHTLLKLEVVVFYQNGKHYVTLTSLIPLGGL